MFILLITIMMFFAGLALDMARVMQVRQIVQSSLDAAALAAAKRFEEPGITEDEIKETARAYFAANIGQVVPAVATITNFLATPDMATSRVLTTVDVVLPTMLAPGALGSISNNAVTLSPTAGTTYSQTRIEVALVLDITGSMQELTSDGLVKLDALKIAAKEFSNVLYSGSPRPNFVRVSIAPYSGSVNAGSFASTLAGIGTDDCVVERDGSEAFTDAVADALKPLGRSAIAIAPYYSCAASPIVPLRDLGVASNRINFEAAIDGLQPSGGTAGHIGIAWGWYLLSNRWSGIWGSNAGAPPSNSVRKVIVVMTDGIFNIAYNNGGLAQGVNTSTTTDGSSGFQALRLCKAMRETGHYTIYTVGFATPPEAATMLKECSGEQNFYDAKDSNKLSTSFRDIASKLISLRLSS